MKQACCASAYDITNIPQVGRFMSWHQTLEGSGFRWMSDLVILRSFQVYLAIIRAKMAKRDY